LLLVAAVVLCGDQPQIPPPRYGMTTKEQATAKAKEQATAKAKCGGLSASAAECAAFGRDDDFLGGLSFV
jgi:hypothetical protein